MSFTEASWKHLQQAYTTILCEIMQGKNLQTHLRDVENAVSELDMIITAEKQKGESTFRLDEIRNDFFYLVFQIKERL